MFKLVKPPSTTMFVTFDPTKSHGFRCGFTMVFSPTTWQISSSPKAFSMGTEPGKGRLSGAEEMGIIVIYPQINHEKPWENHRKMVI